MTTAAVVVTAAVVAAAVVTAAVVTAAVVAAAEIESKMLYIAYQFTHEMTPFLYLTITKKLF